MTRSAIGLLGAGVAVVVALSTVPAEAQNPSLKNSCLTGRVPARDWAELGQQIRESDWDDKGGVALMSTIGGLKLRVVDPLGNSVCQETANNSTSCTFRVGLLSLSKFTIIMDNLEGQEDERYELCAY
jgi:hypothetical protein